MLLFDQQKNLANLLDINIDLEGTKIKLISPTSIKNLFNKDRRKLVPTFREIERKIKEKADLFYENIEKFREVGVIL